MADAPPRQRAKKKPVRKPPKPRIPVANPRDEFHPTAEQRQQVEAMVGFGLTQEQVAMMVTNPATGRGIHVQTLVSHFEREIEVGIAKANLAVVQSLHRNATGRPAEYNQAGQKIRDEVAPNVTAQIWWTKARMGWREPEPINPNATKNYSGADGARRRLAHLLDAEPAAAPAVRGSESTH